MGFYTGFADGEIFDALYNFCDYVETEQSVAHCKEDIKATIGRWRSSFPLKDKKSTRKADLLSKHANKFVDDFYFQCTANKTSKALLDALSKEEKAKTQPGMETEFTLTEESVRDIVQAEVQSLSSQRRPQNSRGRSGRKGTQTPNDVNDSQRKGRASSKGKNRKRSQSTGRKPKQRGQSSNNNRRVSLPKNGGGRGIGHGT